MKSPIMIGIDIGTTNIKFLAMNPNGQPLYLVIKKMQVDHLEPGWSGFNIPVLERNLLTGLKELVSHISSQYQVISIGIDSIGESFLGLNSCGEVITPCPTWFDRRTENYRAEQGIPVPVWYNLTGMVDDDIYTIHRIIWLRKKYPEVVSLVKRWLCIADYAVYILTGEIVTVASLACRTGLLDRNVEQWSPLLTQAAGISEAMLPTVIPSATVAGVLDREVANFIGLPTGTPIIHTGHDHPCAVLGCSVSTSGSIIDSSGTSEAVNTVIAKILDYNDTLEGSYDCYPYVIPGLYSLSGHLPSSGGLFDWLVRLVTGMSPLEFPDLRQIEILMQEVALSPAGANGVRILPFLEGSGTPWHNRSQKAEIRGLKSHHTRGDIIRAAFEGISVWFKINMETICHIIGSPLNPVIAIGGGSKNRIWLEIKSAVIQKPIYIPQVKEAAAQGSAFIGGWAVGYFPDSNISKHLKTIRWTTIEASSELINLYQTVSSDLAYLFYEVLTNKV